MNSSFNTIQWHSSVKDLFLGSDGYKSYAKNDKKYNGRLIPLCTPVSSRPTFLVIGTNHSDFSNDNSMADKIAAMYSERVPEVSTFLEHDHKFIKGLRRIVVKSGLEIDSNWVGTNRCPIQTGPDGIDAIKNSPWFKEITIQMDRLIRDMTRQISPQYVLTCGAYAAETFYGPKINLNEITPRDFPTVHGTTKIIPIWHPSRGTFDAKSVSRLRSTLGMR